MKSLQQLVDILQDLADKSAQNCAVVDVAAGVIVETSWQDLRAAAFAVSRFLQSRSSSEECTVHLYYKSKGALTGAILGCLLSAVSFGGFLIYDHCVLHVNVI